MKFLNDNYCIIGGGLLGLSIAMRLSNIGKKVTIFEKETNLGIHQSGRNSGVLHCGLHYKPGSLKAKLAVEGIKKMIDFCNTNKIEYDQCGKIIVANSESEIRSLNALAKRGLKNGLLGLRKLNKSELRQREPNIKSSSTLLVPDEGIINFSGVVDSMKNIIKNNGGIIKTNEEFLAVKIINKEHIVITKRNEYKFDFIVNCAGIFVDRIYEKCTGKISPIKIIPFRGDYLRFKKKYFNLINHLVYPAPNPKYPFLGVHFTRTIFGNREVGPNAVLAFKREGYKWSNIDFYDLFDSLSYQGLRKFILQNKYFVYKEILTSLYKFKFIEEAKKMMPMIKSEMLMKGNSGVRAQAMDIRGNLIMDFKNKKIQNQVHVLNAPSPGATACLSIADYVIKEYLNV